MTPREIASIWLIGIGALAVIVWDHRSQTASIIGSLKSTPGPLPAATALDVANPATSLGTNAPMPVAGDRQGAMAVYGNGLSGDVQPLDQPFGDIFSSFGG